MKRIIKIYLLCLCSLMVQVAHAEKKIDDIGTIAVSLAEGGKYVIKNVKTNDYLKWDSNGNLTITTTAPVAGSDYSYVMMPASDGTLTLQSQTQVIENINDANTDYVIDITQTGNGPVLAKRSVPAADNICKIKIGDSYLMEYNSCLYTISTDAHDEAQWKAYEVIHEHSYSYDDGKCSCGLQATASVALGTADAVFYFDLTEAFNAAQEGTTASPAAMKLYVDNTVTNNLDYVFNFTKGVISLDLNGHFIDYNLACIFKINGAELTITDSSLSKTGKLQSNMYAIDYNSGKLLINGGYISCLNSSSNLKSGDITLHGGSFGIIYMNSEGEWDKLGMECHAFVDANGKHVIPRYVEVEIHAVSVIPLTEDIAFASVNIDGNSTFYSNPVSAFAAATAAGKAATLTMLNDYEFGNSIANSLITLSSGVITLDLNGHTVTSYSDVFISIEGAELTINDNSSSKSGKLNNYPTVIKYNSGKLLVNGGIFYSRGGTSLISEKENLNSGDITLHGGSFDEIKLYSASDWDKLGMRDYLFVDANGKSVVIGESNTISQKVSVVPLTAENAFASVTIDGNSTLYSNPVSAFATAAAAGKAATLTVLNDYEYTQFANNSRVTLNTGDITLDLNGHTITDRCDVFVTIDGAKLTINDNSTAKNGKIQNMSMVIVYNSGKLTINGGTFSGHNNTLYIAKSNLESGDIALHGGTFICGEKKHSISLMQKSDWEKIEMEGYCLVDSNGELVQTTTKNVIENTVTVTTLTEDLAYAAVTVNGKKTIYASLEQAIAFATKAESPATLTMLKDYNYDTSIQACFFELSEGVLTFDLNGHTLTTSYSCFTINGAEVTFIDGSEAMNGKIIAGNRNYSIIYKTGKLTINSGTYRGLQIYDTKTPDYVTLHGGVFEMDDRSSIYVFHQDYWYHLGMDGYYFFDADNKSIRIEPRLLGLKTTVSVKKHTHTAATEYDNDGFAKCSGCNTILYQPAQQNAEDNYYEISNAGQLRWFAERMSYRDMSNENTHPYSHANARLTKDIDAKCSVSDQWIPISYYTGIFDGNKKTISNLYYDNHNSYGGLMVCIGEIANPGTGSVKDLTITNSSFKNTSTEAVGGIAAYFYGDSIARCTMESSVNIEGYDYCGGIVGYASGESKMSKIAECHNSATIQGRHYCGGIAGEAINVYLTDCTNNADILSFGGSVGGIVGYMRLGSITGCHNDGDVSTTYENNNNLGGIIGCMKEGISIANCYNTGNITGKGDVIGGIAGTIINLSSAEKCYNTGDISTSTTITEGGSKLGGFAGTVSNCTLTNFYNIGNISSQSTSYSPIIGGIAGYSVASYFTNVYSSAKITYPVQTKNCIGAFCGAMTGEKPIANCYANSSLTSYLFDGTWEEEKYPDCMMTSEQFRSGKIAWLLNGGSDENPVWYQAIGKDATPTFVGDEYSVVHYDGSKYYNTSNPATDIIEIESTDRDSSHNRYNTERTQYFNLAGQRLNAPTKGINIINGRKVVVK